MAERFQLYNDFVNNRLNLEERDIYDPIHSLVVEALKEREEYISKCHQKELEFMNQYPYYNSLEFLTENFFIAFSLLTFDRCKFQEQHAKFHLDPKPPKGISSNVDNYCLDMVNFINSEDQNSVSGERFRGIIQRTSSVILHFIQVNYYHQKTLLIKDVGRLYAVLDMVWRYDQVKLNGCNIDLVNQEKAVIETIMNEKLSVFKSNLSDVVYHLYQKVLDLKQDKRKRRSYDPIEVDSMIILFQELYTLYE
jgi:hypothetical protein